MSRILKKENIVISIREYQDNQGNNKKVYKTVGELVTMMGDDGTSYQFGEMWSPTGAQKFNVYDQQERKQAPAEQASRPQDQQETTDAVNSFDDHIPF